MNLIKSACLLFIFITSITYSQIRINEVCASNSESLYDEDSDTPDWIELYNYSSEPVSLKDWRISDKNNFANAWQFPDTIMKPSSYLIVYASGKDRVGQNNISMNVHSSFSIVPFNNRDGFRFRYLKIGGDFEATLNVKSMRNEGEWSEVGLQARESLTDTTNFFLMFASARKKDGFFNYKREKELDVPNRVQIYGGLNLPHTKLWIKRSNDSLYCAYIDLWGERINEEVYPNYLPDSVYFGISVSGFNKNDTAEFIVSDLVLNSETIDILKMNLYEVNVLTEGYDYNHKELHSNFSIKDDETLYLFNNNVLSDTVKLQTMTGDVTNIYSQYNEWLITDKYTPGSKNSGGYLGRLSKPIISFKDGKLQITDTNNAVIRYTTDNSYPTNSSKAFIQNQNIVFDKTTTVKAVVFKDNYLQSFASSNVYFINEPETTLPIVSISADSTDLWGNAGIMLNNNLLFPRQISANFNYIFQNVNLSKNVKIKVHGNNSKYRPQKSFRIYANDDFESDNIKNIFFDSKLSEYDQIVLRNSGTDWSETFIKDAYNSNIAKKIPNLITASYQPVLYYQNSEFYGLMNIRERLDDDFLAEYYNIDDNLINYYEDNGDYKSGDFWKYKEYYNFIQNQDFSKIEKYNLIDSLIDIDNFINYNVFQIFAANIDWPWKNIKIFQSNKIDSKFRYMIHDMDWTYSMYDNKAYQNRIGDYLNDEFSHLASISKKFLNNKQFKTEFMTRACDLVNSVFKTENMVKVLDSLSNQIRPYISLQQERWEESCVNWEEKLDEMKFYLKERPFYFMKNFNYHLNNDIGTSMFNLSTYPPQSGTFKVNTINVDTSEWSGRYFQTLPITVTAIPKQGMKFVKWNHDSLGTNATITTTLPELIDLEALFEKSQTTIQDIQIVINEIMYNAVETADSKDWVELYNAGKESINLNGWSLIDEDITHESFVINEDYLIEPDEYVILTKEKKEFGKHITIINKIFGDFTFGIGGNDILVLKDKNGKVQDSVNYDNDAPWPTNADGTGMTIELINPELDNNLGENWVASKSILGTPGKQNSNYDGNITSVEVIDNKLDCEVEFINNILNVSSNELIQRIDLFDITGRKLNEFTVDNNRAEYNLSDYNSGLYIGTIVTKNGSQSFKLIIRK